MKKTLLIITALTLLIVSSCRNKHEEMTFDFSKANVTEKSVEVTVTPSDLERDYFLGILPSSDVKSKDDAQIISEVGDYDAFKKLRGEQSYILNDAQPETDYVALAFCCKDAEKVARYTMRTLAATNDSVPEDTEDISLELSTDKNSILSDGEDVVTFAVKLNGEIMNEDYLILNVNDSSAVNSNSFSTTKAGVYAFVAIYNNVYSNEVEVEAKAVEEPEPIVEIVADKTEILNNGIDKVTFTVKVDGAIMTNNIQILNVETDVPLVGNEFFTVEAGIYTFVAVYDDVKSNEIQIKVNQVPNPVVELVSDKNTIKNNGIDKVTFTVLVDGADMTSESVIYNNTDNINLESNTFASDQIGDYVFSAIYNGFKSEELTISVKEALVYSPGDLYDVDGVKGVVFYVEEGGKNGLIMSMDEESLQWSTENVWTNCLSNNGEWNTEDMLKLGEDKYPAAKWCVDHGEGWYLPSSYELNLMWHAVSNGTYDYDEEFIKLYNDKLDDPILEDYYWSSSEISEDMAEVVVFIDSSMICLDPLKTHYFNVRAIRRF